MGYWATANVFYGVKLEDPWTAADAMGYDDVGDWIDDVESASILGEGMTIVQLGHMDNTTGYFLASFAARASYTAEIFVPPDETGLVHRLQVACEKLGLSFSCEPAWYVGAEFG